METMRYIKIAPEQKIILKAKRGVTPTQAIWEAIKFCQEHNTKECDLVYEGFTFGIEPDSDINQLVGDYWHWYQSPKVNDEAEVIGHDEESE